MKKYLRLIGILLFIIIILNVDLKKIWEVFLKADHLILLLIVCMNLIVVSFRSLRWSKLVKIQGLSFSFIKAFFGYLRSLYFGNITPARAGELLRVHYLLKYVNTNFAVALSGVLFDKMLDMYFLLILGMFGFFISNFLQGEFFVVIKWFFFLMVVVIPAFLIFPEIIKPLLGLFPDYKNLRNRSISWLTNFFNSMKCFLSYKTIIPALLTLCTYLFFFIQCYLVAYSINLGIDFFYLSLCVVFFSIVSVLPVSISNFGTREFVLITMFGYKHINSEFAVSFSLLFFLTINFSLAVLGLLAFIFYKDDTSMAG